MSVEKAGLLGNIKCLQHNLEQQCNLRGKHNYIFVIRQKEKHKTEKQIAVTSEEVFYVLGENEKLKNVILGLKKQNEQKVEVIHKIK